MAKLVAEAAMSPMLFEMSADGTPIVAFKHQSSRLPSGKVVPHKAKPTEEFLVRNQVVPCTLPDGRVEMRVVVRDPVPLKHWKSAHAIVEALRRDGKTGRRLGHAGAQWNRAGSIGLRCHPRSAPGSKCTLPTRRAMMVCRQACPQTSSA